MERFDLVIVVVAIILLHLWAARSWLRFFRQEEEAKRIEENKKDGEIVKANAVPMVNNT